MRIVTLVALGLIAIGGVALAQAATAHLELMQTLDSVEKEARAIADHADAAPLDRLAHSAQVIEVAVRRLPELTARDEVAQPMAHHLEDTAGQLIADIADHDRESAGDDAGYLLAELDQLRHTVGRIT